MDPVQKIQKMSNILVVKKEAFENLYTANSL